MNPPVPTTYEIALGVLILVYLVFFIIAAYQILSSKVLPLGYKCLWLAVIILLPVLGVVLYFVLRRRHPDTAFG